MNENPLSKIFKDQQEMTEKIRSAVQPAKPIDLTSLLTRTDLTVKPMDEVLNSSGKRMQQLEESIREAKEAERQQEIEYRESVLSALQGIEKNTALLTEMTSLLQKNNDKQEEMFQLMVEILEIAKSKDQVEADSKFKAVMTKITTFTDNASTIQTLYGMANAVYTAYQSLPF